jgi:hypothetical protein
VDTNKVVVEAVVAVTKEGADADIMEMTKTVALALSRRTLPLPLKSPQPRIHLSPLFLPPVLGSHHQPPGSVVHRTGVALVPVSTKADDELWPSYVGAAGMLALPLPIHVKQITNIY